MMSLNRWSTAALAVLAALLFAGCEPISEPWVSGRQAEALENERTRTDEQKQALRERLQRYGDAYQ